MSGGDKARDEAFAAQQADALEAEIAFTQLSPIARRVLDAEVRRLRDVAAMSLARNSLVRDLQEPTSRVVSLTPKPMPAVTDTTCRNCGHSLAAHTVLTDGRAICYGTASPPVACQCNRYEPEASE
jgi:hypothetical protein